MNKIFTIFILLSIWSPYAALADNRAAIFESQPPTASKSKIGLWRAFKRQARSASPGTDCDTLILTYGAVVVGRIKSRNADYLIVVPCDSSTTKGRRISRDIIHKVHRGQRKGDSLTQKKSAIGNRTALTLGLLSVAMWLLFLVSLESLGYLALLFVFFPPLMGLIACLIGIANVRKPEAGKGLAGIILGLFSMLVVVLLFTL